MSLDLAVQKAIRSQLVGSSTITALVPPSGILDRNSVPAPRPSIVLGETQMVDDNAPLARNRTRVVHTIHAWKTEPSREGMKVLCWAIRQVLHNVRLRLDLGFHCIDCRVTSSRILSDPDGLTSHGVVTVEILADEVVP